MVKTNSYITFLRSYGPIPSSDNMYDELIRTRIEANGIEPPLEVEAERLSRLVENFSSEHPASVILTGTAGDGKTYHCRRLFEQLGGHVRTWQRGDWLMTLQLPNSRRELSIVKDLSEVAPESKKILLSSLHDAMTERDPSKAFLIAANDGHLVASLQAWAQDNEENAKLFKEVEQMLVEDQSESQGYPLQMYNLSRSRPDEVFGNISDAIVNHRKWDDCIGCELYKSEEETTCPIRMNRKLLMNAVSGQQSCFRERIGELMKLTSANDMHLPIRQLFLLCVNILLGDSQAPQNLMSCEDAKKRSNEMRSSRIAKKPRVNPFANVFGHNLDESLRFQYSIFTLLDPLGIGRETNNAIDNKLVTRSYQNEDLYHELFAHDPYADWKRYSLLLRNYIEGERTKSSLRNFFKVLSEHRQKLFFRPNGGNEDFERWDLTVFASGGLYLDFVECLRTGRRNTGISGKLALGLNRTFTGLMVEEKRDILITSSGGDNRGRLSSVYLNSIVLGDVPKRAHINFRLGDSKTIPEIVVCGDNGELVETMQLQLAHFEFLTRIARGGLPANYSRQCYEDFLDFKLRLIQYFGEARMDFVTIKNDGSLDRTPIDLAE